MRLLVVRHAIAAPRESFRGSDAERPLTEEGRARMQAGARGLRSLVPNLDCIATSSLVRAVETGRILSAAYEGPAGIEVDCLRPDAGVAALASWLASQSAEETLAVVGHEPDLSIAVSWLCCGLEDCGVAFGKGGAALLELPGAAGAAQATLRWLLRPGQLRRLA